MDKAKLFTLKASTLALLFAATSAGPAMPTSSEGCPELCLASATGQTYGSDFFVHFSEVEDGTGKPECARPCTNCKGTILYTYIGTLRWSVGTVTEGGGGVQTGNGATGGVLVVTSSCDDTSPGGVAMDVGNPPVPGFTAQIFCVCM